MKTALKAIFLAVQRYLSRPSPAELAVEAELRKIREAEERSLRKILKFSDKELRLVAEKASRKAAKGA